MSSAETSIRERRDAAYQHYLAGRFAEAIRLQIEVVNELRGDTSRAAADALKRLGLYFYIGGDYRSSAQALTAASEFAADDPEISGNLGVVLNRLGEYAKAKVWLERALARKPEDTNILDALAHCHGSLKEDEAARRYGERSLELKAKAAEAGSDIYRLPPEPPPRFDVTKPEANIIAYSLWGEDPRYLEGALRNARLAPDLYPGWTCRFYVDDTVPAAALDMLRRYGAQVVERPRPGKFYEGLLWRFEVISDPKIERFLTRDADSLLGAREKAAVDVWLSSDKYFHVMRDFYTHTELILAGMWGGVGGILPPVTELLRGYLSTTAPTRHLDQLLLRACVWPRIRSSVLVHDSWFRLLNTVPFPANAWGRPGTHVGQNFSTTPRSREEPHAWGILPN